MTPDALWKELIATISPTNPLNLELTALQWLDHKLGTSEMDVPNLREIIQDAVDGFEEWFDDIPLGDCVQEALRAHGLDIDEINGTTKIVASER